MGRVSQRRWRTLNGARRGRRADKTVATVHGGDSIGSGTVVYANPVASMYRHAIKDGLAAAQHGRVRTLADMSPEERAAIERQYGAPIRSVAREDAREPSEND